MLKTPTPEHIARFIAIVGEANAITDAREQSPYVREWRDRYVGATPLVLRPGNVDEVASILQLANDERIAIVPQGGNTGLVGGQIPSRNNTEIVLSLSRLASIRGIDGNAASLTCEAGVTLASVQRAADDAGRLFPLSLASEGSAQIGGVLATNAGGTAVLAYGNARNLVLGLEVVLADGRIWRDLKGLKKDNTGYCLRELMIGSEGTLGIITAATLKLVPKSRDVATAVVMLASADNVSALFQRCETDAGSGLTTFEFWCKAIQDLAVAHMPDVRAPTTSNAGWAALIEISSPRDDGSASALLQSILQRAADDNIIADAVLAQSHSQRNDFWRLRDSFSQAQKSAGGSIKHDISVPVSKLVDFLDKAKPVVEAVAPGCRPLPFGHFGDGNVHYNVSQPIGMATADYLALWPVMTRAVHDLVHAMGGSISAEHGIGQMKREDLAHYASPVAIDMMRAIKRALDPHGILNPGKVL